MCLLSSHTNSAISKDCNISLKLLETRFPSANRFGSGNLQTKGRLLSSHTNSAISKDCNISLKLLETRFLSANRFGSGNLQTKGRVSWALNEILQFLEIAMFVRNKKPHLLRG